MIENTARQIVYEVSRAPEVLKRVLTETEPRLANYMLLIMLFIPIVRHTARMP